jgi:hypothetical protein
MEDFIQVSVARIDAPWANVPVVLDIDYMTNINLRSLTLHPGWRIYQYPGHNRPGNNSQNMPGVLDVFLFGTSMYQTVNVWEKQL